MLLQLENYDREAVSNETGLGDFLLSSLALLTPQVSTMVGGTIP